MEDLKTSWKNFLDEPEQMNQEIMKGFRHLIQNRSIMVEGNQFYIYKKLYTYYPSTGHYWRKCAWTYLKENNPALSESRASFVDMETGELLDAFSLKKTS